MSVAYGLDVQPQNDPYITTAEQGVHSLVVAAVPGAFLVDALPFLKYVPEWMPGAGFQTKAREWKKLARRMVEVPYEAAKQRIVRCCFCEEEIDCPNLNVRRLARLRCPLPPSASRQWSLVLVMMHIKRILFKRLLVPFMLVCSMFTRKLCRSSNGSLSGGSDTVRKELFSTVVPPTTSHHRFRLFLQLPPAYWVYLINPMY